MRSTSRLLSAFITLAVLLAACSKTPPAKQGNNAVQAVTPAPQAKNPAQAVAAADPGPSANGSPSPTDITAKLSELAGQVQARESQDASFAQARLGYILQLLGQVQTQNDGKARLDFSTGTLLRVGPNTLFTLQPTQQNTQGLIIRLQLDLGQLWIILRGGGSLQVQTKTGVAAVLGSFLSVSYDPATGVLRITCLEGHCSLTTSAGTVEITTGQTAEVSGTDQTPQVGTMTTQDFQAWLDTNPEAVAYVSGSGTATNSTPVASTGGNHKGGQGKGKGQSGNQGNGKGGGKP